MQTQPEDSRSPLFPVVSRYLQPLMSAGETVRSIICGICWLTHSKCPVYSALRVHSTSKRQLWFQSNSCWYEQSWEGRWVRTEQLILILPWVLPKADGSSVTVVSAYPVKLFNTERCWGLFPLSFSPVASSFSLHKYVLSCPLCGWYTGALQYRTMGSAPICNPLQQLPFYTVYFHLILVGTCFLCELISQVHSRDSDFWESRNHHGFAEPHAIHSAGGIQLGKL